MIKLIFAKSIINTNNDKSNIYAISNIVFKIKKVRRKIQGSADAILLWNRILETLDRIMKTVKRREIQSKYLQ